MKLLSSLAIVCLLALPAVSAVTGDPIDGNDRPNGTVDADCAMAYQYPSCGWCWEICWYAMMEEAYFGGGISWDWNC